jgi:hypothetical protein
MRRYTIFFIGVVLLLMSITTAEGAIAPNIIVSDFSVTDGSAEVGKSFNLSVTLINTAPETCANNIITSVQASLPFIVDGLSSISVGDLCSVSKKVVTVPIKVDPTSSGGSYQLIISNNYESATSAQFSSSSTLNIYVSGSPVINVYIISSNPIDIYAGDTGTITVSIQNDGTFQAQSVNANLKADKPLEVKWSKSMSSISLLEAKQARTADFVIEVPKNAEAKGYNLKLEVQYLDENLVLQKVTFPLTFQVQKKAMFELNISGNQKLYQNQNSRIIDLSVKNTGTDTAYKIKTKLLPQYPISTDGSVRYIDMLQPGKTADIKLSVDIDKDGTPGSYGLDVLFDFEDAQGKELQDTAKVSLTIQQKSPLRRIFIDYWFIWLAVIITAVLVAKRKMGKKIKES